jgi:hypothetical protein
LAKDSKMVTLTDHTVPTELPSMKRPSSADVYLRKKKKLKVNFNLTIDIRHDDDARVPQGPNSLSDVSDVESLSEPIPTTPGGKPQVRCTFPE